MERTHRSSRHRAEEARQRERLLEAIVEVVEREGYLTATVGHVARRAHTSRASFYSHFTSKEDCFRAAHRREAERVSAKLEQSVADAEPHAALHAMVRELADLASCEPAVFTYLVHRAMVAGPGSWKERDRLLERLGRMVDDSWARAREDAPVVDVSSQLLLEGAVRLLSVMIRRQRPITGSIVSDLLGWIDCYAVAPRRPRWRELVAHPALTRDELLGTTTPALPRPLPRRRTRRHRDAVKTVQRERISYATATAIRERGLTELTVADVVRSSGLSRDVFYAHFHDTEEAFEESVKLVFESLMAAMAGAYFYCAGDWPEKIWATGQAFVDFLEANATFAHLIPIGTNAPLSSVARVDDFVQAFTIFIDSGYHYRPQAEEVPRLISDALVCAVLEAVTFRVRHERVRELRGIVPMIVYMVLAPFLGPQEAELFVDSKTRAVERRLERASWAGASTGSYEAGCPDRFSSLDRVSRR
jgi:AcrR family transcriptional regulator